MLVPLLLLVQAVPAPAPAVPATPSRIDTILADYREQTRSDVPCRAPADPNEIVVCAGRDADRYRVPFVTRDAGRESDAARMAQLLGPEQSGVVPCGKGAFMVHCGSAGVTVSVGFDGSVRQVKRELAP